MQSSTTYAARLAAALLAVGGLVLPSMASAQDVPSYARPGYASNDETLQGRIQSIDGTFNITVRDDRGFIDAVELHQGTIINPTGLTLADGMSVTITGHNVGNEFAANEIDTPYHYAGPAPVSVFYGPGWWYPGYAYGYGPSFSLAFVFGSGWINRPFDPYYHGGYYRHEYFTRGVAVVPHGFVGRGFAGTTYRTGGEYRRPLNEARGYATPARGYTEGHAYANRGYATPSRGYAGESHAYATRGSAAPSRGNGAPAYARSEGSHAARAAHPSGEGGRRR